MKIFKVIPVLLIAVSLCVACGAKKKEMSLQDFLKIDTEIATTDQKPESLEKVAQKYGYTLKQYNEFVQKVDKDPALQEKLGEIRLSDIKSKEKK